MLFVIHALDKPEHEAVRKANVDAHVAYLPTSSVKLVLAGPLMAEDVAAPIGSLLIVEAQSLEEVRRFTAGDPYTRAGPSRTFGSRRSRRLWAGSARTLSAGLAMVTRIRTALSSHNPAGEA
jgi:uncharacterized protein